MILTHQSIHPSIDQSMTIPTDVAISRRGKFLVQVHFIDSLYSYLLSCPCDDDNALHLIIRSLTRTCSPPSPVQCPDRLKKILIHPRAVCLLLLPTSSVRTRPVYLLRVQGSDTVTTGIGLESMSHAPGDSMRCSNEGSAYNYLFTHHPIIIIITFQIDWLYQDDL